ncbi:hypothetical protein MSAN_02286400 [Mycena sanguinolenta]|uniref:Uncharacterized protein n=1 Tax=Mycena sanguinolenta TaxID=230812 RepID=A0A8H6X8R9_9AGAR|nr:hypothetical protein MSAN_02286400 [Mycena sanguinolenta]
MKFNTSFLALAFCSTAIAQNLTSANAPAVYSAVCASSDSAVGQAAIASDINNVTVNVLAIQDKFDNIRTTLSIIDNEHLDSRQLSPAWGQLSQNWTNLLWSSRTLASSIIVYCNELTDVLLPILQTVDPATAASTLVDYKQESAPLNTSSHALAVGFEELQGDILNFYKMYVDFAANQTIVDNSTITELQTDIANLQSDIAIYRQKIADLGIAIGATVAGDVVLIGLFPQFSVILLAAGVGAIAGETAELEQDKARVATDENNINIDNEKIEALVAELQLIAAAQKNLELVNTTAAAASGEMNAFTDIWNAVNTDINKAVDYLDTSINQTNDTIIPILWWATLQEVPDCVYGPLMDGLNNYTIGIANSGLPQPTVSTVSLQMQAMESSDHHARTMDIISAHVPGFEGHDLN